MKNTKVIFILLIFSCLTFSCQQSDQITVWTIGDSMMAQKKQNTTERGWGMLFPEFVDATKVQIKNYGKDGRSSKSFVDEGWWTMVLDSLQPDDFVLIQFGHNDEKTEARLHTDPATTYRDYLKKFVDEIRSKGATPVLLTSIVRRDFDAQGNLVDTHGDFPEATRQTAKKLNVPLIDLELKTRQMERIAGWEGTRQFHQYEPPGEIDNTHLGNFGAYIVARMVAEDIKKQNIDIPLSSAPNTLAGAGDNTLDLAYQYFSDGIQSAQKALSELSTASGVGNLSVAIAAAQNNDQKHSFKNLREIDYASQSLRQAELACRWTQSIPFDVTFALGNASFEEGAGWNSAVGAVVPLAWKLDAELKNGHINLENKDASNGNYCYAITVDEGSSIDYYQDVTLLSGDYLLTVDLNPAPESKTKLYVKVANQEYDTPATGSESSLGNTLVKFSVPVDNATVRLGVYSSASIVIDNFKLTKVK